MITIERVNHSGAYIVSALVTDKNTPFSWYERATFYGYPKKDLRKLYLEYLDQKGMRLVD